MSAIKTEYKGFTIEYLESCEQWSCEIQSGRNSSIVKDKLADIKKKIDDFYKTESATNPVKAIIVKDYGYRGTEFGNSVIITSPASESDRCWVKTNGKRSKEYLSVYALDTALNGVIIKQIQACNEKIKALNADKDELFKQLQMVTQSDFVPVNKPDLKEEQCAAS